MELIQRVVSTLMYGNGPNGVSKQVSETLL